MSQGLLCPNLTKKVQKEVSQMANCKLSCAMLYGWFKCKLKLPKNQHKTKVKSSLNEIMKVYLATVTYFMCDLLFENGCFVKF